MLGAKIGEETGRVTGRRVLAGDEDMRFVRMEISFEAEATVLGTRGTSAGTYTVVERGPGQVYGQGQGMFMGTNGETAIWNGHGVARIDEQGGMHFAASVVYQTTSEKLAKLNGLLALVEHHVDAQNNTRSDLYEWTA